MAGKKRRAAPALDPGAMLVFAAMAREGGVRGAATALGMPKSTVSRRLAELEATLGVSLVLRDARRFALTEAGLALAQRCEALAALVGQTEAELGRGATEPAGTLRVSAAPVFGEEVLPAVLADLLARHPSLRVDVKLSVDYADLRSGEVDVVLRAWPIADAADLYATKLGVTVTGCWAAPAYLAKHPEPATPHELASHQCIVVGASSAPRWSFRVDGDEVAVAVSGRARVDSFRLARELAVRGVGILRTVEPFAAEAVADGRLVPILEDCWIETPVHAVHAGARQGTPKVRAFVAAVRAAVAATTIVRSGT